MSKTKKILYALSALVIISAIAVGVYFIGADRYKVYDDEKVIWSLPYKMSKRLREKCSYTLDDTYARILFIDNGTVKAYSEIEAKYASFSFIKFPNNKPILYFKQDLILDKDRYVHIYEE
jgi:hypothetical protein